MGLFKFLSDSVKESFSGKPFVARCDNCERMTNQIAYYKDGIKLRKCYRCGGVWKSYY
jgi:hypothetical protein